MNKNILVIGGGNNAKELIKALNQIESSDSIKGRTIIIDNFSGIANSLYDEMIAEQGVQISRHNDIRSRPYGKKYRNLPFKP